MTAPLPAPRDDKAQRLYNLAYVLRWSPTPLTLEQLRRDTGYYRQPDPAAARRQFERDKADLLSAGVPLEVTETPDGVGYTIDRRTSALPPVELTPDEVAALSLAVAAARDARARHAFEKVAARLALPEGAAADVAEAGAGPVDLRADDAPLDLLRAVRERRIVRFEYPGSDGVTQRVVYPYRLVQRRGAWYVRGLDRARQAQRTFRLDRFVGPVEVDVNPWAFPPPAADELAASVVPDSHEALADVEVDAEPAAHAALERLGARRLEAVDVGAVAGGVGKGGVGNSGVGTGDVVRFQLRGVDRYTAVQVLAAQADRVVVHDDGVAALVDRRLERVLDAQVHGTGEVDR